MKWFSIHYIKPYVESQPKDDGETLQFSLLEGELYPYQQESLDSVTAFYAVHGFRLGLKMGLALGEDLKIM